MTPRALLRHQAAYRRLVALTPQRHRTRHGDDQVTLFGDLLRAGETPLKLWVGVVPDLLGVLASYREELSRHLTRAVLAVLGVAPIGVGLVIGSIWVEEYGDVPVLFPATAAALVLQGSFGAIWLTRRVDGWRRLADGLFVTGEVAALAVGTMVVVIAVSTRSPTNPETLHLVAGAVAAIHAVLGLTAFQKTGRRPTADQ
jgi:hypothetical protein